MAKKPGRPPKIKKQEKFVGFFVTKVQHFVIQQKATKLVSRMAIIKGGNN